MSEVTGCEIDQGGAGLTDNLDADQRLYIKWRARGLTRHAASQRVGVSRNTSKSWEDQNWFWPAVEAEQERILGDPTEMLNELVPKAWKVIEQRLAKGDLYAAQDVLDRRYGKPTQRQEVSGKNGERMVFTLHLDNPNDAGR